MAYRIADGILAGSGVTKAAGGAYVAQREAYARAWFRSSPWSSAGPVSSRSRWTRTCRSCAASTSGPGAEGGRAQAFDTSVRGAREPHQTLPFDPELMRLHAHLGPPAPGPQINGHGAGAPEGGQ